MNSASLINYEIRPCKFVERKMLLVSFARIISMFKQNYQYIGFGGLAFTDFKLFHKELYINKMYSIEGGDYSLERLSINNPYSYISIKKGMSTEVLRSIDLSLPSIIWLDYDDVLSMTVFDDINIAFQALSHGSLFLISCNRQLRNNKGTPYTPDELYDIFGTVIPIDLPNDCCSDQNTPNTIYKLLLYSCNKVIEDRNKLGANIKFVPLINIKYNEYRGARMYTFGGIILKKEFDESSLNVDDLEFIRTDQAYEISIPNLSFREKLYINQILGNDDKEKDVIDKGIISQQDLSDYKKSYRFMPNFYDVRI